jgi:Polyketide cyclase / dehydrase and lipid transport
MIRTGLEIPAAAAVAWRLLIDTEAWPRWGPSVIAVDAPARHIGPAMSGRVQTALGPWLPFEITDWHAGVRWSWRVAGVPATGHVVESLGPGRCRVAFTIPIWAPFYVPVCRAALRRLRDLALAEAD